MSAVGTVFKKSDVEWSLKEFRLYLLSVWNKTLPVKDALNKRSPEDKIFNVLEVFSEGTGDRVLQMICQNDQGPPCTVNFFTNHSYLPASLFAHQCLTNIWEWIQEETHEETKISLKKLKISFDREGGFSVFDLRSNKPIPGLTSAWYEKKIEPSLSSSLSYSVFSTGSFAFPRVRSASTGTFSFYSSGESGVSSGSLARARSAPMPALTGLSGDEEGFFFR